MIPSDKVQSIEREELEILTQPPITTIEVKVKSPNLPKRFKNFGNRIYRNFGDYADHTALNSRG